LMLNDNNFHFETTQSHLSNSEYQTPT